jgi:hypothetical protein
LRDDDHQTMSADDVEAISLRFEGIGGQDDSCYSVSDPDAMRIAEHIDGKAHVNTHRPLRPTLRIPLPVGQ